MFTAKIDIDKDKIDIKVRNEISVDLAKRCGVGTWLASLIRFPTADSSGAQIVCVVYAWRFPLADAVH